MESQDTDTGSGDKDGDESGGGGVFKELLPTCGFHLSTSTEDVHTNLISPRDIASWRTIVEAAKIRQCSDVLNIAASVGENVVPLFFYHANCRSTFIHNKNLDRIFSSCDQRTSHDLDEMKMSRPKRCKVSHNSVLLNKNICIICNKASKYVKKSNSREPLTKCMEFRADMRIREFANRVQDQRLLGIVGCYELVAAEAHYHLSCYKKCAGPKYCGDDADLAAEPCESHDAVDPITKAFNFVCAHIRQVICEKPAVMSINNLTRIYVEELIRTGQLDRIKSAKKNLRRKLENEFKEDLHFCNAENGRVLVYPSALTIEQLVIENHQLKKELETYRTSTADESAILTAGIKVRSEIMAMKPLYTFPYVTQMNEFAAEDLPHCLSRLLNIITSGKFGSTTGSLFRRVHSIASDIIYATTAGRMKLSKHILLPYGIKSLTGNVEIIHILNRLGHGIGYCQLQEIETAVAMQRLESSFPILPETIEPEIFTMLAWDNIDNLEETLSGLGTSHRVNGIAIQRRVEGPRNKVVNKEIIRTGQRSLTVIETPLPAYISKDRCGPGNCHTVEKQFDDYSKFSNNLNYVWVMARSESSSAQAIPSWTGFNIRSCSDKVVTGDNIVYLTPINASAAQLSTVFEVLQRSIAIKKTLHLAAIPCVFDQALYAKAAEIVWSSGGDFAGLILCMGSFHTICTFLRVLGKRFQDAGLLDLLVETNVVASGSVVAVLEGRQYNRGVRMHKLLFEALMRLVFTHFLVWLEHLSQEVQQQLSEGIARVHALQNKLNLCQDEITALLNLGCVQTLLNEFHMFMNHLRFSNGPLSAFWMSYIDMVSIMLNLIRATRDGDWTLNLCSLHAMIPWFFAYDHSNYARYLPVYYADMSRLEDDHPEIYQEFMSGAFSVQLSSENPFGRIPVDQTIEETVNKSTKIPGGTKGFSTNFKAVKRHYLTSDTRSLILNQLRLCTSVDKHGYRHPDLSPSRIQRDERDIKSIIYMLTKSWIDPFDSNTDLVSISSGTLASADVAADLMRAQSAGEEAHATFKLERLESNVVKFHDPLRKMKLKTFTDMKKSVSCKTNDKNIILRGDKNLFGKIIFLSQKRSLDMKKVLSHPLGPTPFELANADGSIRKNNKSSLAANIFKDVSSNVIVKHPAACIIDGMSLVHRLPPNITKLGQAAQTLLKIVISSSGDCERVDVVFDVYKSVTIKGTERQRRSVGSTTTYSNLQSGHDIRQWSKFLSVSENKSQFIRFLNDEWSTEQSRQYLKQKTLYVTSGENCQRLTATGRDSVACLTSNQEEADTRILLHIQHAVSTGLNNIIIVCEDTDVAILLLTFCATWKARLFLRTGTGARLKLTSVNTAADNLGLQVCAALPGLHAFTGCDTVSAFAGRGKIRALNLVKNSDDYQKLFEEVGLNWTVSNELFAGLERFTCELYSIKNTTSVNDCRYRLFCAKNGEIDSHQLPPAQDCLELHIRRANYQAAIWRRSLQANDDTPSPHGHGWLLKQSDDGQDGLEIEWMKGLPAPMAVLELLACQCKKTCDVGSCSCIENKMHCTEMCKLQDCSNSATDDDCPATEPNDVEDCYSDEDED
jgi:hypothetical protein